jgi:hypothetical protein
MKRVIFILIIQLVLVSCGKKDEPPQDYIQIDEKSVVNSVSTEAKLDKLAHTPELKEITFDEDTCDTNNIQTDLLIFSDKIESLGGNITDLSNYEQDSVDFQKFLSDSGVTNFTGNDFSSAGTRSKMKTCDLKDLTPPKSCWYRTLTLALITEKIENETGINLEITSHYRDRCYNKSVGGSKRSDHIAAKAIDFSLNNQQNRHRVEQFVCDQFWKENFFQGNDSSLLNNISIGVGETFLHLGVDSIHGRRHWLYSDYIKKNSMPTTCWKK